MTLSTDADTLGRADSKGRLQRLEGSGRESEGRHDDLGASGDTEGAHPEFESGRSAGQSDSVLHPNLRADRIFEGVQLGANRSDPSAAQSAGYRSDVTVIDRRSRHVDRVHCPTGALPSGAPFSEATILHRDGKVMIIVQFLCDLSKIGMSVAVVGGYDHLAGTVKLSVGRGCP